LLTVFLSPLSLSLFYVSLLNLKGFYFFGTLDPLFTLEMYSVFVEMSKIEDSLKRLEALKQLVHQLPGMKQS
jgi:hypothetical protein